MLLGGQSSGRGEGDGESASSWRWRRRIVYFLFLVAQFFLFLIEDRERSRGATEVKRRAVFIPKVSFTYKLMTLTLNTRAELSPRQQVGSSLSASASSRSRLYMVRPSYAESLPLLGITTLILNLLAGFGTNRPHREFKTPFPLYVHRQASGLGLCAV